MTKTNMVGILFKMTINPFISSTPFASIREVSYFYFVSVKLTKLIIIVHCTKWILNLQRIMIKNFTL
jgi:hypothetical protein